MVLADNFRGGDGNVGIIRSPVRAIALPDCRLLFTDGLSRKRRFPMNGSSTIRNRPKCEQGRRTRDSTLQLRKRTRFE